MQMLKYLCLMLCVGTFCARAVSQPNQLPQKSQVMTLGTFHFNFPNLDVHKVDEKDKIDVLQKRYQKEIASIVKSLRTFRPTAIAIEAPTASRERLDSLYTAYRRGIHTLGRSETEQLGFRLAKELGLEHLECVDVWGNLCENLNYLMSDTSSRAKAFEQFYFHNPDSVYLEKDPGSGFSHGRGILDNLIALNDPVAIRKSLGPYLIGHFKYEEQPGDYTGADFETGRWFNRNLRIFRNVQRIPKERSERILVIYGAGHLNVLNYLFSSSPEYEYVSPLPYLEEARGMR